MNVLVLCAFALCVSLTVTAHAEGPPDRNVKASNERVQKLFDAMRDGKYDQHDFPKLKYEDIPALVEMGKSERVLKEFPRNMESSQFEAECREGMVALWLVEGIRKEPFPSLNALCVTHRPASGKLSEQSEMNHAEVLMAYQKWWTRVRGLSADEAKKIDPLEKTKFVWY